MGSHGRHDRRPELSSCLAGEVLALVPFGTAAPALDATMPSHQQLRREGTYMW